MKCLDCKFWAPLTIGLQEALDRKHADNSFSIHTIVRDGFSRRPDSIGHEVEDFIQRGNCRVSAPRATAPDRATQNPGRRWPTTLEEDWCGKFEKRP